MPKKKSSKSSKKSEKKGKARYKNIYFGEDSVFKAVKDVGRPGVNTWDELLHIAASQLADLEDLKTKDHDGRVKIWVHTPKEAREKNAVSWGGRSFILWQVFKRLKAKGKVGKEEAKKLAMITRSGHRIMEIKDREKRVRAIKAVLKRVGLKESEIKNLLETTNK